VLAGFESEHGTDRVDAGWSEVEWFNAGGLSGGMANTSDVDDHQQDRERLWLSPHCVAEAAQQSLWPAGGSGGRVL
jgi:hypothetical protein